MTWDRSPPSNSPEGERLLHGIVSSPRGGWEGTNISAVVAMRVDVHHQSAWLVEWHIIEVEEVGLPVAFHIFGAIGGDTRLAVVALSLRYLVKEETETSAEAVRDAFLLPVAIEAKLHAMVGGSAQVGVAITTDERVLVVQDVYLLE